MSHHGYREFSGGSVVKNPLEMQEAQFRSLDWEDHLEEGMATHSSILARIIPGKPWWATVHRTTKSQTQLK